MFTSLWLFILSLIRLGPFLLSYVSNNTNTFPRPLSAKEEAECLKRMQEGDESAKNKLIEFVKSLDELTDMQRAQLAQDFIASYSIATSFEQFVSYMNNGGIR